jgi:endonuclease/exonuclease/phosphatase (EEP) superfamily protein YafD
MLQPKHSPLHYNRTSKRLASSFTLLSWNINKRTLDKHAAHYSKTLFTKESVDIIALQEAKAELDVHTLYTFPSVMSPNIQTRKNIYGVQTASNYSFKAYQQHLTDTKESFFATRKSALVTLHDCEDGSHVSVVNIHAINFVPHRQYKKELVRIVECIRDIEGSMILCGDFNSWNKKRYETMMYIVKDLGLKEVVFDSKQHIKSFNRQPLDYIFYRGLSIVSKKVLDSPTVSDHNPLIVRFRKRFP